MSINFIKKACSIHQSCKIITAHMTSSIVFLQCKHYDIVYIAYCLHLTFFWKNCLPLIISWWFTCCWNFPLLWMDVKFYSRNHKTKTSKGFHHFPKLYRVIFNRQNIWPMKIMTDEFFLSIIITHHHQIGCSRIDCIDTFLLIFLVFDWCIKVFFWDTRLTHYFYRCKF